MTEEFLQYVWKHTLFDRARLFTSDGKQVEIIRVGHHNHDSGPDFFNARLKIDGVLWAGNVEVHVKSSAWGQHKHQYDEAYKNVILHVVWEDDEPVMRADKTMIPAIELHNILPAAMYNRYAALRFSSKEIPCENDIGKVDGMVINPWLDRLLAERLERKTDYINTKLNKTINDWEETFYQLLLRTLGSPVNAEPFERLANALPYKHIVKHSMQPLQVEALLFGQAGMLDADMKDEYPQKLYKEYEYLKHKLGLTAMSKAEWKFMRMRPPNFPTMRIAQLAGILTKHQHLFRSVIEATNAKDIFKLFAVKPNTYWQTHYRFDKATKNKNEAVMGNITIELLIINAVVPILFLYGKHSSNEEATDKALAILHSIKPEKNSIIDKWKTLGISAHDAYDTQALIQLRKEYCDKKLCIHCAIGHKLMNKK